MEKFFYKITFLIPVLKGAGAERNVVNLVNYFNKKEYRAIVAAGRIEGDFKNQLQNSAALLDFNSWGILSLFFSLVRYLKKDKPHILISAFPHVNVISILAKIFSSATTKIILTEHTIFSLIPKTAENFCKKMVAKFILPHLMRLLYPLADSIICVSKAVANDLCKIIPDTDKIKIVYNPVVGRDIYELGKEALEQDFLSFKKGAPVIIAVGRLVKAKDYPTLLKAFKIVHDKKPVRLVILGEGPEEENLKKYASQLKILQDVCFLGFKSNPYKYMANSSVFVMSSLREGFGNAIVEAMALGVPVVATDCGGPGEIIENNKTGILVPIKDEKCLAAAIFDILENPILAEKFSKESRIRARDFSIEKGVQEYEKIFEELLI